MRRARILAAAACAAWLAVAAAGCARDEAPRYAAPAQERAMWVLEPPQLALGDVAELSLSVVTRPGATLEPHELPAPPQGLFAVAREPLAVEHEPARWVHTTRLRLRAVAVGRFELPGGVVRGEDAEGSALEIPYPPIAVEVASTLGENPERRTPWGVRRLPAPPVGGTGAAFAFGAGAATALAAAGAVALARRRAAERSARAAEPPPVPSAPPWELAHAALDAAEARLADDPRAALDAVARALRGYVAARYGADAPARTVEELAVAQPPFAMTTRWQGFVALLAALDAERFPSPAALRDSAAARLLREARDFVAATLPQEGLR
jgi:hypothetical protein